jgi:Flp pilus assembly protein TadG
MFKTALKALAGSAKPLRILAANFRANSRANVAIITGIAAIPMVSAVGCVVDYSMASMIRTKLQAAADAATLATVSKNSPIVTTAKTMAGNGSVSGGSTYATNFFSAETTAFTGTNPAATVTKTGTVISATATYSYQVPTFFMKVVGFPNITVSGSSTASFTLPAYINFYLMLDVSGSMSFPSTTAEMTRLMAVNPDNLHPANSPPANGYPQGCQFACHFSAQGTCSQTQAQSWGGANGPWQGLWPYAGQNIPSQWPSSSGGYPTAANAGYCMGFIITRLGTSAASPAGCTSNPPLYTNDSSTPASPGSGKPSGCGQYVNWSNSQVSSCPSPGTTSCIQLRADAVGFAVNALLSQAVTTETNDGLANQFQVGLFPFIQNLCTASTGSSNSCSVGLTNSLTGGTITTFASQLANLLDTGQNATLGSGGTHFENALNSMNTFITNAAIGTGTGPNNALPYVFIVTDGSQDYQTQSGGNWQSQHWTSNATVPYQNSSTIIPPNTEDTNNYCATMKGRGITVAVLYIPYGTIVNPNPAFANNEDGYANANIQNIPTALQNCASPGFYYTANTPTDITNALVTMFEQAVSTAHVSQ